MKRENIFVGVDLGGTDIKCALVGESGKIARRDKKPTMVERGPEDILRRVAATVRSLARAGGVKVKDLAAVGIGVPGPMSGRLGVVFEAPNLPGWKNVEVRKILEKRLRGVPVVVSNDANAAAYGEFWLGAGRDVKTMIAYTLGTGVGGGIILDGELWTGIDDTAGELGHVTIFPGGEKCGCGSCGCLEQYASGTAVKRRVREVLAAGEKTSLRKHGKKTEITPKDVYNEAVKGDAVAIRLLGEVGVALGIAAAGVINMLNPEMIVICGGLIGAGDFIFKPLREAAKAHSFKRPFRRAKIVPAELGGDAGVIGAAGLAIKGLMRGK